MTDQKENYFDNGFYFDLPDQLYRKARGVSNSSLRDLATCPKLYHYSEVEGNRAEATANMVLGTAAHTMTLTPAYMKDQLIIEPADLKATTKAGKELRAKLVDQARAEGKTLIPAAAFTEACAIAEAVHAHPAAAHLLGDGYPEVSVFHTIDGQQVKCRIDWVGYDYLVDLKTTDAVDATSFARAITNFNYDRQAASYLDIANEAAGTTRYHAFFFIAAMRKPPYLVGVYQMGESFMQRGRQSYAALLELLALCRDTNTWPGVNDDQITTLEAPRWALAA